MTLARAGFALWLVACNVPTGGNGSETKGESQKKSESQKKDKSEIKMVESAMIPIEDLWRTLPEPVAGGSRSYTLPERDKAGAGYVQFLNGFRAGTASEPGAMDSPSEVWHIDARTGTLLRKEPYAGPHVWVPLTSGRPGARDAAARVGPLQNALAPAFFRGDERVPVELEAKAKEYREAFAAAEDPGMIRFYVEMAPQWCAWVGIAAR